MEIKSYDYVFLLPDDGPGRTIRMITLPEKSGLYILINNFLSKDILEYTKSGEYGPLPVIRINMSPNDINLLSKYTLSGILSIYSIDISNIVTQFMLNKSSYKHIEYIEGTLNISNYDEILKVLFGYNRIAISSQWEQIWLANRWNIISDKINIEYPIFKYNQLRSFIIGYSHHISGIISDGLDIDTSNELKLMNKLYPTHISGYNIINFIYNTPLISASFPIVAGYNTEFSEIRRSNEYYPCVKVDENTYITNNYIFVKYSFNRYIFHPYIPHFQQCLSLVVNNIRRFIPSESFLYCISTKLLPIDYSKIRENSNNGFLYRILTYNIFENSNPDSVIFNEDPWINDTILRIPKIAEIKHEFTQRINGFIKLTVHPHTGISIYLKIQD